MAVTHVVIKVVLDGSRWIGDSLFGLTDGRYRLRVRPPATVGRIVCFQFYGAAVITDGLIVIEGVKMCGATGVVQAGVVRV